MSMSPRINADRWGLVAKHLIESRDRLYWLAKPTDENGIRDTAEHKECYQRAARALGPAIAEAVRNQREIEKQIEASEPPRRPPAPPITDEQFEALGQECANDPTFTHMMRQGRPATNVEMHAWMAHQNDSCVSFVRNFMEWLDTIQEQSGLAAVAARLSVPSPVCSEMSNV